MGSYFINVWIFLCTRALFYFIKLCSTQLWHPKFAVTKYKYLLFGYWHLIALFTKYFSFIKDSTTGWKHHQDQDLVVWGEVNMHDSSHHWPANMSHTTHVMTEVWLWWQLVEYLRSLLSDDCLSVDDFGNVICLFCLIRVSAIMFTLTPVSGVWALLIISSASNCDNKSDQPGPLILIAGLSLFLDFLISLSTPFTRRLSFRITCTDPVQELDQSELRLGWLTNRSPGNHRIVAGIRRLGLSFSSDVWEWRCQWL